MRIKGKANFVKEPRYSWARTKQKTKFKDVRPTSGSKGNKIKERMYLFFHKKREITQTRCCCALGVKKIDCVNEKNKKKSMSFLDMEMEEEINSNQNKSDKCFYKVFFFHPSAS